MFFYYISHLNIRFDQRGNGTVCEHSFYGIHKVRCYKLLYKSTFTIYTDLEPQNHIDIEIVLYATNQRLKITSINYS